VETLRHVPVRGTLFVVDSESIELSNLQRYVLAMDADEGRPKTALIAKALAQTGLTARQLRQR